ncbi:hypothetical protein EHE19_002190 [Ruminiclostridium herbifermentans]|uniref:HNH endonuclease n=1 Tax=Ruminiclostridium herbifermentans TaxID=2488810 RepID=A0A4U7JJC8_9FIRM|nr:hypothetical protein [Ruminiclostridium herbifermentans]QNU67373.1 hypothetical protein EHE19_002190 [Ruminiclostridium herbifermentans]
MKQCALCRQEVEQLELSHIVPKFVVRYLKKTSIGAIRNLQNPDKVVQDSEKHYLLCSDCESLFNVYETKFANTFFHPYMTGNKKIFQFDSDAYYFLTSVSWRSLYLDILDFVEHSEEVGIDMETLTCFIEREKVMRSYLLKKQSTVPRIENHMFFFEDIKSISQELIETRPHITMHRSIGSYTFFNKTLKTLATVTNMMGIVVFTLYNKSKQEKLVNTEIINGTGVIKAENQIIEGVCGSKLIEMLNNAKELAANISDKQREIINNRVKTKVEDFRKSKAFEDLKKDFNL